MKNVDASNAQTVSKGAANKSQLSASSASSSALSPAVPVTTGPNATHDIDGDPIPSWVPQHVRDGNGHPPNNFGANLARAQLAQLEEADKPKV